MFIICKKNRRLRLVACVQLATRDRRGAQCARAVGVDDLHRLVYGSPHLYLLKFASLPASKSFRNVIPPLTYVTLIYL